MALRAWHPQVLAVWSPERNPLTRREFVAAKMGRFPACRAAVAAVAALAEKGGVDVPRYFLELLCINEFEDRARPATRGGGRRPSSAGLARPSLDQKPGAFDEDDAWRAART